MKFIKVIALFFVGICFSFAQTNTSEIGQKEQVKPNYRLASKFSSQNISKLVHSTNVNPHWLKNGNRFWYQYKTTKGSNYYLVDADKKTKTQLFDNVKMAKWLSEITKDPYDAQHLPKFDFKFVKNTHIDFFTLEVLYSSVVMLIEIFDF